MKNILNYNSYLNEHVSLMNEDDILNLFNKTLIIPTEQSFINLVKDNNVKQELNDLLHNFMSKENTNLKLYYKLKYLLLKLKTENKIPEDTYSQIIYNFDQISLRAISVMEYKEVVNIFKSYFFNVKTGKVSQGAKDKYLNFLGSDLEPNLNVEEENTDVEAYVNSIVDTIENVSVERNILYDRYYLYLPPPKAAANLNAYLHKIQEYLNTNEPKALYYSVVYNLAVLDIVYLRKSYQEFLQHLKLISSELKNKFNINVFSVEQTDIDIDEFKEILKNIVREIIVENADDIFNMEQTRIDTRKILNTEEYEYITKEIRNNYDAFLTVIPKLRARKGSDRIKDINTIFQLLRKNQTQNLRSQKISAYLSSALVKLTIIKELRFIRPLDYQTIKNALKHFNLRSATFLDRHEDINPQNVIRKIQSLLEEFTDFDTHADDLEVKQLKYYDIYNENRLRPFPFFKNLEIDDEIVYVENAQNLESQHKNTLLKLLQEIKAKSNKATIETAKLLEKYFFTYFYFSGVYSYEQYLEKLKQSNAVLNYLREKYGETLSDPYSVNQNSLTLVYDEYISLMENYDESMMSKYEDTKYSTVDAPEHYAEEEPVEETPTKITHNISTVQMHEDDAEKAERDKKAMLRALEPSVVFSDSSYKKFPGLKPALSGPHFDSESTKFMREFRDLVFEQYLVIEEERNEINEFFAKNEQYKNTLNEYLFEFEACIKTYDTNMEEYNHYIKYKILYYAHKLFYMHKNVNKATQGVISAFSYIKRITKTLFDTYSIFKNSRHNRSFFDLDTKDLVHALNRIFSIGIGYIKDVAIDIPNTAFIANEKLKYIKNFKRYKLK